MNIKWTISVLSYQWKCLQTYVIIRSPHKR